MDKRERLKKYGSIIYCPVGDTLCIYVNREADGSCRLDSCLIKTDQYKLRQRQIEQTYQKNQQKDLGSSEVKEEKEAAAKIRRQNKSKIELLEVQVKRKKQLMEQQYRRGRTRVADQISRELGILEKKLEAMK